MAESGSFQGLTLLTVIRGRRWRRVWVKTDLAMNAMPGIIKNDQKTQHEWNQLFAKHCASIVC